MDLSVELSIGRLIIMIDHSTTRCGLHNFGRARTGAATAVHHIPADLHGCLPDGCGLKAIRRPR